MEDTAPNEVRAQVRNILGSFMFSGDDATKKISCLLYTSDAADERSSVDLGGRRIIKKKNNNRTGDTVRYINNTENNRHKQQKP